MWWLVIMFATGVFLFWVALVWISDTDDSAAAESVGEESIGVAVALTAQVVILERKGQRVTLNCVIAEEAEVVGGDTIAIGTPFVVIGELPESHGWAADATAGVLERWAVTGKTVDFEIVGGARGVSIAVFDDSTRVQLPMAA